MTAPLEVRLTVTAERDLEKIADDLVDARGADFALGYVARLRGRIDSLATLPRRYRERRKPGTRYRLLPEPPYHVYYRVEPNHVLILRILHGRRKVKRSDLAF